RAAQSGTTTVRLWSVVSPLDGGLLPDVIADFDQQTNYRVTLSTAEDVYGPARAGRADIVLSHSGHEDVVSFVLDGFGLWPRLVFSNQLALLGPPDDPAGVRGVEDLVDAFSRIALAKVPFVVNDSEGVRYLSEVLWHAAGQPPRQGWYVDQGSRQGAASTAAAEAHGYTIWGLTPFWRAQQQAAVELEPLLLTDPLLQRVMVTIVVNSRHVPAVNETGAIA